MSIFSCTFALSFKNIMKLSNEDIMKACKKASREEEIKAHGHPISFERIVRDRTIYTRKEKHKINFANF